ncbi:MBL fold metallo-hydrolase [Phreatobacter aquaticus]|uniref:MBL fold metallo-hydrolase n=1 Tax=Phreatobacter aquaticus TaxID=2570229 RepID=A0A4D7QF21_9HYPH|nr:MBL fold metallo-hydrolase [Phreatobacter aquaticus]QCK85435.1 MBL fold metallo-hydrolase [Phreatobacter aquaticus]
MSQDQVVRSPRPESNLDFTSVATPAAGEVVEITEGLHWARMPLPFVLNHVNVWFLPETAGWTAVDAGVESPDMRALWQRLVKGPLGRPLVKLVATHGHTDHIGLAGHLVDRFDMPFASTLVEWLSAKLRYADQQQPHRPHVQRFLAQNGCHPDLIKRLADDRAMFAKALGPQPSEIERLIDGRTLRMGGRDWQVMTAGGHAEEHASFYSAESRVLIAGDQILSHITPVIGIFPGEPKADPLGDYLVSLERFRTLPEDTLVLPSHGTPFRGLHRRLDALRDHHAGRLDMLRAGVDRPMSGYEAAHVLFPRAMAAGHAFLAVAETLAHLRRLEVDGSFVSIDGRDGVRRFAQG